PMDGAAKGRWAGWWSVLYQPGAVGLVVACSRAEVAHDRLVVVRQQADTNELVHRPGADVRGRDVADVRHVEAEERAQLGALQVVLRAGEPLAAQPVEVGPLLPVDLHRSVGAQRHFAPPLLPAQL